MRILIGDSWHDSESVPICIIVEQHEIDALNAGKKGKPQAIVSWPAHWPVERARRFAEDAKLALDTFVPGNGASPQ